MFKEQNVKKYAYENYRNLGECNAAEIKSSLVHFCLQKEKAGKSRKFFFLLIKIKIFLKDGNIEIKVEIYEKSEIAIKVKI